MSSKRSQISHASHGSGASFTSHACQAIHDHYENQLNLLWLSNSIAHNVIIFCYGVGRRPPIYFFDKTHTIVH